MGFAHNNQWHMLVTARANMGAPDGRGAIGQATSDNLINWQVQNRYLHRAILVKWKCPKCVLFKGAIIFLFGIRKISLRRPAR